MVEVVPILKDAQRSNFRMEIVVWMYEVGPLLHKYISLVYNICGLYNIILHTQGKWEWISYELDLLDVLHNIFLALTITTLSFLKAHSNTNTTTSTNYFQMSEEYMVQFVLFFIVSSLTLVFLLVQITN